jgi:hypothetical protein
MSSFWSGNVGPVLVRTLRATAQSRTRREGVTQYCPEIADDDMGQALGRSCPSNIGHLCPIEEKRHSSIEINGASFELKAAYQISPTWLEGSSICGCLSVSCLRILRVLYLSFALPIYACNTVTFSSVNHKSLDESDDHLQVIQEQGYYPTGIQRLN